MSRFLSRNFFSFFLFALVLNFGQLTADPLPSWNEGAAKNAIIRFVKDVTEKNGKHYIAPEDRIVAFDEDGTLWVEQPINAQLFFAVNKIKSMAKHYPEWKNKEPFKKILACDKEALRQLSLKDVAHILAVATSCVTVDSFHNAVFSWMERAIHPHFERHFYELVYEPMREVMDFLRENQFDIYIVSGAGQEFIRSFAKKLYGIEPSHVIGTASKVKFEYKDGKPVLLKLPEILFVDYKAGKPEGINLIVGKRPIAAFGNSDGDEEMLEWTSTGPGRHLEMLIHHDDAQREYAYGPETKVGTFSDALMEKAKKNGWIVVSMKNDWKKIFSWENDQHR